MHRQGQAGRKWTVVLTQPSQARGLLCHGVHVCQQGVWRPVSRLDFLFFYSWTDKPQSKSFHLLFCVIHHLGSRICFTSSKEGRMQLSTCGKNVNRTQCSNKENIVRHQDRRRPRPAPFLRAAPSPSVLGSIVRKPGPCSSP